MVLPTRTICLNGPAKRERTACCPANRYRRSWRRFRKLRRPGRNIFRSGRLPFWMKTVNWSPRYSRRFTCAVSVKVETTSKAAWSMTSCQGPVILYDGFCGFCDLIVRSLLRFDRRKVFLFAPLQGDFARTVVAAHKSLEHVDSIVLVEAFHGAGKMTVSVRSAALLGIARQLGGLWRIFLVLGLFFPSGKMYLG